MTIPTYARCRRSSRLPTSTSRRSWQRNDQHEASEVRPEIRILLISALAASLGAHAGSCDGASALATARKFVDKVVLSPDCTTGLKEFDADEYWIHDCAGLEGPRR